MADLTIVAAEVSPVKVIEQHTVPSNEAVDAGEAIYFVAASGKAGLADENVAAPVNEPEGIAIANAGVAGETLTFVKQGWLDLGDALDSMNYGDTIFLSATAGKLADVDPGNGIIMGEVWPSFGSTTADKIMRVDIKSLADIAPNSVTNTMLAGGFMNVTLVNGGAAGNHTVTGIATGDEIVFVGHFSTAASIATLADLTSEFSIDSANTIDNAAGTATTNDQLMVIWNDLT